MWMIYGAYGYTGDLIAREAVRRGHKPIVAGRDAARTEALARELGLPSRVFDLSQPDLSGISLVVHCAGPFLHTSKIMVNACLAAGVHYLDITGEIAVFESVFKRDEEAKKRGILLLPGVGFDVVPTDCLAAALHERMPDATELWLAFASFGGGISRGTLKTMLEGAGWGGAIRENGRIRRVPQVFDARQIPFPSGPRWTMTIPWGDVSTAYRTTGIPNIRVYSAYPRSTIRQLRLFRGLMPILRLRPIQRLAQKYADRRRGPDETQRATSRVELWGRVRNAKGEEATMTHTMGEGYDFTARSAVQAVEHVLASPTPGAMTPTMALGRTFCRAVGAGAGAGAGAD
ncbi:MAG: saccharopine dehydrogenase NADP-binding domain-containing protein [Acidobacteriota bacterium]